jgi:PKD repeat protein
MKTVRLILLASVAILIVASLSGCLRRSQPQALFTVTHTEDVIPFTVSFNGTLSYTPDGEIVSYLWTFGDGGSETGPLVEHTYREDGKYEAQLLVIDERGVSSSTLMTIQALNPLPTASFSYSPRSSMDGDIIVGASEDITFDAADSTDDGEITAYSWNFGDGEYAEGPLVVHSYLYPGTYNAVLTVTDNDGGQSIYIERITVLGGPPCNADITDAVPWN